MEITLELNIRLPLSSNFTSRTLLSTQYKHRLTQISGSRVNCQMIIFTNLATSTVSGYHAVDAIVLLPVGSTRVMFEEKRVTYNLLGKCLMFAVLVVTTGLNRSMRVFTHKIIHQKP